MKWYRITSMFLGISTALSMFSGFTQSIMASGDSVRNTVLEENRAGERQESDWLVSDTSVVLEGTLFPDVSSSDPNYKGIQYCKEHSIMTGYADGLFHSSDSINRAMVATILWRLNGRPEVSGQGFSDVAQDAYFKTASTWARQAGIMSGNGTTNKTFDGADPIRRQDLALIFYRLAGKTSSGSAAYGNDLKSGHYAYDAVNWALNNHLIELLSGTFNGGSAASRGITATLIQRHAANGGTFTAKPGTSSPQNPDSGPNDTDVYSEVLNQYKQASSVGYSELVKNYSTYASKFPYVNMDYLASRMAGPGFDIGYSIGELSGNELVILETASYGYSVIDIFKISNGKAVNPFNGQARSYGFRYRAGLNVMPNKTLCRFESGGYNSSLGEFYSLQKDSATASFLIGLMVEPAGSSLSPLYSKALSKGSWQRISEAEYKKLMAQYGSTSGYAFQNVQKLLTMN